MSRSPAKASSLPRSPVKRERFPCDLPECEREYPHPIDANMYVALNYKDLPELLEDYEENYKILEDSTVLAHLAKRFDLPESESFRELLEIYEIVHPEKKDEIRAIKIRILKSRGAIPPETSSERLLNLVNFS